MTFLRVNYLLLFFSAAIVMPCYGQAVEAPAEKQEPAKPVVEEAKKKFVEKPAVGPKAEPVIPLILGWKEWVWVVKPELILRAKLDTGARTCSIHATNIETLELDGKKWVKFTISDPASEKGVHFRHKAPVLRIAKVKNDTGGLDERYVVPLTFQIGGKKIDAEFNLNDRSQMNYAVLLGRNILQELGAVDSSRENLLGKPKAPSKSKKPKKKSSTKK